MQFDGPPLAAAKQTNEALRGPDGAWRQPVVQMSNGDDLRVYVGLDRSKVSRVRSGALRGAFKALQARFPTLDLRIVQREGMVAVGLLPLLYLRFDKDTHEVERTWNTSTVEKLKLDVEALAAALP